MTRRDRDFGEFVRRSLHAAAEPVMIGQDGPARIHARLAAVRLADAAASRGAVRAGGTSGTVLAGMGGAGPGRLSGRWSALKGEASVASAPSRATWGRDCPGARPGYGQRQPR